MPMLLTFVALLISVMVTPVILNVRDTADRSLGEVILRPDGCDARRYTIAAGDRPELYVRNEAREPMVFAVTEFDQLVVVEPGEQVLMPVQAFVWGSFSYLCMTEAAHDAAMGGRSKSQFICGLDAFVLRPQALSEGELVIEPHSRMQFLEPATGAQP